MKNGESLQQQYLFQWIRIMARKDWKYDKIHAIPNGGLRAKRTAITLKKEGAKSGVWDIFIPIPMNGYSGMYIEMKFGKNKLTENQIKFRENLEDYYLFMVFYDWKEAKESIENYLNGLFSNTKEK